MFKRFAKYSMGHKILRCNEVTIKVLVANTESARAKGLSGTSQIAPDEGMLFDFGAEQPISMWMKNCKFDMSIAFITKNGVIVDIQDMSKDTPTRLHHSPISVKYALEVNKGFFARHNIATGDKISI